MLRIVLIFLITFQYSLSTTSVGTIKNAQFIPDESPFNIINISSIDSQLNCICQCLSNSMCVTATHQGISNICSVFSAQLLQGQLKLMAPNQSITTITVPNNNVAVYGVNLLMNGDGEKGSCEMGNGITHPTGWSFYGAITQISYNDTQYGSQYYSTPGPSDRGKCYFVGNNGQNQSMSQIVNLNVFAPDIDSGNVSFNLSAWLGGWQGQNDSAAVSIYFQNSALQLVGNRTTIGPVLDADRAGITATVFRQKIALIPVNSRWMTLTVNMTVFFGQWNDGSVDNIRVEFERG